MADRSGRPSRRGGERSYDDHNRRDRFGRGGRDRDRDNRRDHDGDGDVGRERNRARDRDYRRHRSRSKDRRDRRRSRSPIRDRGSNRRDERQRDDRGPRHRDESTDDLRGRGKRADGDKGQKPHRSTSPPLRRDTTELDTRLPTRSKPATPTAGAGPVSFKVKAQDSREGSRGLEQQRREDSHDSRDNQHHDDEDDSAKDRFASDPMIEDQEELIVEDDSMDAMQAMLGFGGFGTTKGQKVLGNNVGAVRKEKKTEYRQYMNRVGGFNRPLSPSR